MAKQIKPYNFLAELFPKQFKTVPSIIIWTLVFLADVAIVFAVGYLLGIPLPLGGGAAGKLGLMLYLLAAGGLFCLESFVYNRITQ